jgi:hypothetical protein
MIFDNISFHDSQIIKVIENTKESTLDFIIDYPVNWDKNTFEIRVLRFLDVIFYNVDEIRFKGLITILNIFDLGEEKKMFNVGGNQIETIKSKVEIQTNAGNRIIEFSHCDFVKDSFVRRAYWRVNAYMQYYLLK